jgi:amino acid transporter
MPAASLKRSLRYPDLIFYGLCYIAPFSVLGTLGFVWTASNGLIALAYIIGSVCMYFTAVSYATMTETLPSAGSVYGFARHALGMFSGFMAGWMILLDYLLIPAVIYMLMAVALETLLPAVHRSVWIVLLVTITTGVNWFGLSVTSRFNFISVALQFFILVGFMGLCVTALHAGKGNGALTLKPIFNAASFELGKLSSATSICVMSFLGFDAISTLAEEVVGDGRQVLGKAIIAVLVLSAVFFVVFTWVAGNLLPGLTIKDPASAAYELAAWGTGPWTAAVLAWGTATVVGLSNALPMQTAVARVVFAMGRDRQLPTILARIHPKYHTPYVAMLITAALSLVVAESMKDRLSDLVSVVNFGALSGFLFLHISVIAFFGVRHRSRAWLRHWLVPIAGILVVLSVLSGMSAPALKLGVLWVAGGMVYALILKSKHREDLRVPL